MDNKHLKTYLKEIEDEGNAHDTLQNQSARINSHVLIAFLNEHPRYQMVDIEFLTRHNGTDIYDQRARTWYLQRKCQENTGHQLEIHDGMQFCTICKATPQPYDSMKGDTPT